MRVAPVIAVPIPEGQQIVAHQPIYQPGLGTYQPPLVIYQPPPPPPPIRKELQAFQCRPFWCAYLLFPIVGQLLLCFVRPFQFTIEVNEDGEYIDLQGKNRDVDCLCACFCCGCFCHEDEITTENGGRGKTCALITFFGNARKVRQLLLENKLDGEEEEEEEEEEDSDKEESEDA
jgi:hypothetical protein